MPHKVSTVDMLDDVSTSVQVCGACNAVRKEADGQLVGDMFDGQGFVRGLARKGRPAKGASALVLALVVLVQRLQSPWQKLGWNTWRSKIHAQRQWKN